MQVFDVRICDIIVGERQRKDFGDMEGLKFSIEQNGLLQPVVLEPRPDGRFNLIAGGRRLKAHQELERETIQATLRDGLDELSKLELEYEENAQRKNLTMWEEIEAIAKIHKLKKEKYNKGLPGRFGRGGWSQRDTALQLDMSEGKISQDLLLSEAVVTFPQLKEAKNRKEALYMLRHIDIQREDDSVLVKRIKDTFVNKPPLDGAKDLDDDSVDLLITDVTLVDPFEVVGIVSDKLNITGHAFVFLPLEKFTDLNIYISKEAHLQTKARPYVWHVKGEDTFQTYLWCSKGMASPPRYVTDHTSHRRDVTAEHNLAKPYSLYNLLIDNASLKGGFVYNPVCYDLAIVKACFDLGRSCRAVCPSKVVYDQCILSLEKKGEQQ